ncbi:MAG: hypothetical protein ACE5IW_13425, partial [bacterium]
MKLYEIENGVRRITKRIAKRKPVEEYLKYQARYKHILKDEEMLARVRYETNFSGETSDLSTA